MTDQAFRKDLSNVSWEQIYARQALRAELVPGWLDALRLKAGDRVLEIGAGPGYVSFALAERVGPQGLVYALDRSAAALEYLERLKAERGIAHIRTIAADAATWDGAGCPADSALVTMVLHHTDDPAGILANVARLVPLGAPVVIGEFDPQGPCEVGPPRQSRLSVEKLLTWCASAGLVVQRSLNQTPEHYLVVTERRA
ncbi:MAG TPA: methyltransferase domain-containing protein [Alphaproteobacteria bacterium]|nr:methyltransferase domain-containing protein [Alphaproteobacteria bacterium]